MSDIKFVNNLDLLQNDLRNVSMVDFNNTNWRSGTITIPVDTSVQFDSFSSASYRSAEYLMQFSQNTTFMQTKLLVIHNGTDIGLTEYASVSTGNSIPYEIGAEFSGGNLELTITCSTALINSVTVKYSRVLFDA